MRYLLTFFLYFALSLPVFAETRFAQFWLDQNAKDHRKIDHSAWQVFLNTHVSAADDGIHRVAYGAAASSESRALLTRYLQYLAQTDPRGYNRQEQMAFWINLYNALTVDLVLDHPHKKSIRNMGGGFLPTGPWDNKVVHIAGQPLSLNDIEHQILRPIWQDHRIHFSVNCASLGCPNLSLEAFNSENLERLLDSGEQAYLSHPRGAKLVNNKLHLSSIFDWYQSDFANSEDALLDYLSMHLSWLKPASRPRISYHYDWDLNSQIPR